MKKTNAINLVLITAAMAACNRPLYQQRSDGYDDPGYSTDAPAGPLTAGPGSMPTAGPGAGLTADAADSTNSCPVESSELPPDYYDWYNGMGAFGSFTVDFNLNGFYAYRNPAPPPPLVRVNPVRSFFTRAFTNIPHLMSPNRVALYPVENHPASVRHIPASTHPTVARSGFGARVGMAVHS
jgi:hypothetical protein